MHGKSVTVRTEEERITLVKTLAESASVQAKVTNRIWLAVIAVTFTSLFPTETGVVIGKTLVKMPFNFGSLSPDIYYPVMFLLLSILVVALAAAHAQHCRADKIAHHIVDGLTSFEKTDEVLISFHVRDLFDLLRHPGFTRVAPLSQIITGHYHTSMNDDSECTESVSGSKWKRLPRVTYYVLLKLFVLLVLFGIPIVGLWVVYQEAREHVADWLDIILAVAGAVALLTLVITAIADSRLVHRNCVKIWKGTVSDKAT